MSSLRERAHRIWVDWNHGLPSTTPDKERVGLIVGLGATFWMLLVAAWGIGGSYGDGHIAAVGSIGVAGDNMWRHHVIYPLLYYVTPPAGPSSSHFYMHHPMGVFWVTALMEKVFGLHNWVLRLPAVIYSTTATFLLYRLGRAIWGPLEGALTALAFVSLPISLGFAAFHSLEVPVIFGLVMASWGYARITQTGRLRYALLGTLGFVWALGYEWSGYVWGIFFLGWVFARAYLLPPRLLGPVDARAVGRYWAFMVVAGLLTFVVQMLLLVDTGKLTELFSMYSVRSSGSAVPLGSVLKTRRVWIELMYPGLAIGLGKVALPVVVGRFFWKRNDLELLALFLLGMAGVHYVHFKQGADVHIFWSHHFATYFALAVGALAATMGDLVPRLLRRARGPLAARFAPHAPFIAAGLVALPLLFVFKDGASMLRLGQESGLRFNSPGIKSDIDRVDALHWGGRKLKPVDQIAFHHGVQPVHWGLCWEMRPHQLVSNQQVGAQGASPRFFHLDSRFATAAELRQAARAFRVEAVGPFWMFDRGAPAGPVEGFSFEEKEPGPLTWYFVSATEPVRKVVPDPWVTWEWRTLLEQPAPAPTGTPKTAEQLRVAHNAAVAAGDKVAAPRWRAELDKQLDLKPPATFDDGTVLIGVRHGRGAERSLTLYFLTGPKGMRGNAKFAAYAKVDKAPLLSTLPQDPDAIEIGMPFTVPTELWKPGHIYSMKFTYRKRPGTERIYGSFVSLDGKPAPVLVGKVKLLDLVTL